MYTTTPGATQGPFEGEGSRYHRCSRKKLQIGVVVTSMGHIWSLAHYVWYTSPPRVTRAIPASGHWRFRGLMTPSRSEQAAPLAPVIPRTRVGLKPGCTVWHEAGLYFYPYCDCRRIYPYWWLLPLFLIFMEVNKFKKNKVVWFRDSHVYMLFYITCRCSYVGLDSILLLFVVGKNDALRAEYTILIFFLY